MKPDNTGYRLNRGYLIGTVVGFLCAVPFTFTHDWLWFYTVFTFIGGMLGWFVAFLRIGGEVN